MKYDFDSLHSVKILDFSKLKAFADDTAFVDDNFDFDVAGIMALGCERVQNFMERRKNCLTFLPLPQCFQELFSIRVVKTQNRVVKNKTSM